MKSSLRYIYADENGVEEKCAKLIKGKKQNISVSKVISKRQKQGDSLYDRYSKALWVGLGVSAFQQLTGINIIIFYSNSVFKKQGDLAPILSTIMSLINFLATFGSVFFADSKFKI